MQLTHQDRDGLTVLTVRGDLVEAETDRFRRVAIERMEAKVRDFVLDCDRLDAIDSKGLETLLWLKNEVEDRLGQVRLARPAEHVKKVLECTRLAARLECEADVESAVRSLRT